MANKTEGAVTLEPEGQGGKSRKRKIRGIRRSAFAMPYLALSVIFVIVPLFIMLYYAFTDLKTGRFTFGNFLD